MPDAENDNVLPVQVKDHTIVTDAEPVASLGWPCHTAGVLQRLFSVSVQRVGNPLSDIWFKALEIPGCPAREDYLVWHCR